jgi:hypothetical protein
MSAVLDRKAASSGIKTTQKDITREIDPQLKETHYVFWAGDNYLPLIEANIGITGLEPFTVTSIQNWGSWQRDQDPKNTPGLKQYPGRKNMLFDTRGKEAGRNAAWLEENYGGRGLIVLKKCIGLTGTVVKSLVDNLLPSLPTEQDNYDTIIATIETNAKKNPSKEHSTVQNSIAKAMIEAIKRAKTNGLRLLASNRAEMEKRKNSGGIGKGALDERDLNLIRLVGRSEADYSTDTRAAGQAAAEQVTKVFTTMAPLMHAPQQPQTAQAPALLTPEQMEQQATIMALAMQKAMLAMSASQQPIAPVTPTPATKPTNKPTSQTPA